MTQWQKTLSLNAMMFLSLGKSEREPECGKRGRYPEWFSPLHVYIHEMMPNFPYMHPPCQAAAHDAKTSQRKKQLAVAVATGCRHRKSKRAFQSGASASQ